MRADLDIRVLRYFVAVAEELHFTRAAQRLFVAQQALSREVRKLEDRLGIALLERSTRKVVLTEAGTLLLARARALISLHDNMLRELQGERPSLIVDVVSPDLLPARILAAARLLAPDVEFFARHLAGPALPVLSPGQLDITFGVWTGVPSLVHRPIWTEPFAALLPSSHPLATLPSVTLEVLRSSNVCVRAGAHVTPGWEYVVASLGFDVAGSHPHVPGAAELALHLRERNAPILTLATQPSIPDSVLVPVSDPAAVFPWSMMWPATFTHPGLTALHTAITKFPYPA